MLSQSWSSLPEESRDRKEMRYCLLDHQTLARRLFYQQYVDTVFVTFNPRPTHAQLVYKQTLPTHASLQSNTSIVTLADKKALSVVDIPGHPRIRDQFTEYLADAKAVVFVVDASTISRNGPAVAEYAIKFSSPRHRR